MSRALVRMKPNDRRNASRTRNAGPRPCVECALTTSWTMSPAIGIGYRREPRRVRLLGVERENQGWQGRRERTVLRTSATEDAASRRFAASQPQPVLLPQEEHV